MTKRNQLTRSCAACGIEKPLSAFLQVSGSHGTTYGSICSTCRGSGIKEKSAMPRPEEDRGSTTSGQRIGAKQKYEIDKEHLRQKRTLEQEHKEELKQREQIATEKIERIDKKEKTEKEHRQTYIEAKKRFLEYQGKKAPDESTPSARAPIEEKTFIQKVHHTTEARKLDAAARYEQRITTIDLSGAPILDQPHYTIARDNPLFKRFMTWLGADAPIMRTLSQLHHKNEPAAPAEHSAKKDFVSEYIEKTWGPTSRKS